MGTKRWPHPYARCVRAVWFGLPVTVDFAHRHHARTTDASRSNPVHQSCRLDNIPRFLHSHSCGRTTGDSLSREGVDPLLRVRELGRTSGSSSPCPSSSRRFHTSGHVCTRCTQNYSKKVPNRLPESSRSASPACSRICPTGGAST